MIQGICSAFLCIKDDFPIAILYDYGSGDQHITARVIDFRLSKEKKLGIIRSKVK